MKKISLILGIVVIICSAFASCSSSHGAGRYTEQDSIANLVAQKLIDDREFVLTASNITLGNSPMLQVTESNNFILVDGNDCTIQFMLNYGALPAITAKGSISGYEVKHNKKGETLIKFHFTSPQGSADISATLFAHSNQAIAYATATFWRGRATLRGKIGSTSRTTIVLKKE